MNTEWMRAVERRAALHGALSDPGRLAVVDLLSRGDASPSELAGALAIPSNLLAHHVNVLVEHGLVEVKSGKSIRKVGTGEGVDIATDAKTRSMFGGDISQTKKWGKGRIEEAYKSVGLL